MESYIKNRLLETTENFKRLAGIYNKWNYNKTMCFHLIETANTFEQIIGTDRTQDEIYKQYALKIKKKLASKGIKTGEVFFNYDRGEKINVVFSAWLKSGCQKSEVMSGIISDIIGRNMRVSACSRMILSTVVNEYVFEEMPNFFELHGGAINSKKKGEVSGDAYTFISNRNNEFVMAISDGMGTGKNAARDSGEVMDFVEEYVEAGFSTEKMPYLINEALMESGRDIPVTIDIAIIDMNTGILKIMKSGGAATFIKKKDEVKIIYPSSLPLGVISEAEPYDAKMQLEDGDYIIMISDGVADCLPFYDKEKQLSKIISESGENNPEKMADRILNECRYFNGGENSDDMTVLVAGVWKIKNLQYKK